MNDKNIVEDLEPSSGNVDIEVLLNKIEFYISQRAILPKGASTAITLWCLATYSINTFRIFPKITIFSPEKRCGKSTVLDLIEAYCFKSLITSNITMAAIYRLIDDHQPTLIIDEADTFVAGKNKEMVGIINSGHAKNRAFVTRCTGDNHEPKRFSTWTPMVLASIGVLQSTIMDRSIIVEIKRKSKTEKVKRIHPDLQDKSISKRQDLLKWSLDNMEELKLNQIEPPSLGNDRSVDNWIPLFTIANKVSTSWLKKCELAYKSLNNFEEEPLESTLLLSDIQKILKDHGENKIPSVDLVSKLVELKDHPWCEWKGKPLSQNGLACMLKPYGIKPKGIRYNNFTPRGYELAQFTDAFDRYLT